MIKLQALENFTLERFDELQNIERKNPNKNEKGKLYENDEFECNKELADYLLGNNAIHRAVVKVIEVEPEIIKTNDEIKIKKDNVEVIINKNEIVKEIKKQSKKKKSNKK